MGGCVIIHDDVTVRCLDLQQQTTKTDEIMKGAEAEKREIAQDARFEIFGI